MLALVVVAGCGARAIEAPIAEEATPVLASDACPDDAEDVDGFEDDDGCPDLDDDGDGIPDAADACRCVAEDRDGFEDDDGCPDEDNDRDRIVDACDACPNEIEVYDGCADDDGCPDSSAVRVRSTYIRVVEHVEFDSRSAALRPSSIPVLEAIRDTLAGYPQVTRIRITGHVDAAEARGRGRGRELGLQRAAAVRDWLLAEGIDPGRLEIDSAGGDHPLVPHASVALRHRNRRAELTLVEVDGQPGAAPPASSPEPEPDAASSGTCPDAPSLCPDGPPPPAPDLCLDDAR